MLMKPGDRVSLEQLYPKSLHHPDFDPDSVFLKVVPFEQWEKMADQFPGKESERDAIIVLDEKGQGRKVTKIPESVIMVPGVNNRGFDIGLGLPLYTGGQGFLCFEMRYSKPASTTKEPLKGILRKKALVDTDFVKEFAGETKEEDQSRLRLAPGALWLIVICFRKLTGFNPSSLPLNTLVFGPDRVQALYGPTLASRPQFVMEQYALSSAVDPDDDE